MNNILIIEDEEVVSEVTKAYLEKEVYIGYSREKGFEGIELFNKVDFKFISQEITSCYIKK